MNLPPPFEDHLTGACVRLDERTILLTGARWQAALSAGADVLLSGALVLRYGLPYLYEADALIPQLVYDDHRQQHTGRELFAFVEARGRAYPRADVIGVRLSGGDDHVFLRDLDLALPLEVMAHSRDVPDSAPVRLQAAVLVEEVAAGREPIKAGDEEAGLPDLLTRHVACFRLSPSRLTELPSLLAGQSSQRP